MTGDYNAAFYFAGAVVFFSGIMLFLVPTMSEKEIKKRMLNEQLAWQVGKTANNWNLSEILSTNQKSVGQLILCLYAGVVVMPLGQSTADQRRKSVSVPVKRNSVAIIDLQRRRRSLVVHAKRRRLTICHGICLPVDVVAEKVETKENSITGEEKNIGNSTTMFTKL